MTEFKFKIGDMVCSKVSLEEALAKCQAGQLALPHIWIVLERLSQECQGGLQLHYQIVREGQFQRVTELEIVAKPTSFVEFVIAYSKAVSTALREELKTG